MHHYSNGNRWYGRCGSLWMVLCIGYSAVVQSSVTLSVAGQRGVTQLALVAGERVRVEVRLEGFGTQQRAWPTIPGIRPEWVIGRQQSNELSLVAGTQRHAQSFIFDVCFPTPGTVRLGPVSVTQDNGAVAVSQQVECSITADAAGVTARSLDKGHLSAFLAWEVAEGYTAAPVYPGQMVPISLALYTTDRSIEIEGISPALLSHGSLRLAEQPVWREAMHNGKRYDCCVWDGILIPQRRGVIWLPAVTVAFSVPSQQQTGHGFAWQMMAPFFRQPGEERRAPPLQLTVAEVPPLPTGVSSASYGGVGADISIQLTAEPKQSVAGSAVLVTRTITGCFDPDGVVLHPFGEDAPTSVVVHPSRVTVTGALPQYTRHEEWVVQGLTPCSWEIAAQEYWFFNPQKHAYEQRLSNGLSIVFFEQAISSAQDSTLPPVQLPSPTAAEGSAMMYAATTVKPLSIRWLIMLILMPVLMNLLWNRVGMLGWYLWWRWQVARARRRAYRALQGERADDVQVIYETLDRLFGLLIPVGMSPAQWLAEHGGTQELQDEWKLFWYEMEQYRFVRAAERSGMAGKRLRIQALIWVERLSALALPSWRLMKAPL